MNQFSIGIVFFLSTAAFAHSHDDSFDFSDSGITGPKYAEILSSVESLRNQYSTLVSLQDYGKSVQGRTLRAFVVMKNGVTVGTRPAVLMTGSTHGNEYLNIEDRLAEQLLKRSSEAGAISDYLNAGGAFIFVPILNPDGYDARKRENANGVDLNRDWDVPSAGFKGFKQTETKLLSEKVASLVTSLNLKLKVTVDYHCCVGALLHPLSYTDKAIPATALQGHLALGDIAKKYLNVEVGTTPKILGYYPLGTTKDYYYEKYGAFAFTYEGRYKVENANLEKHVGWWEDMVKTLKSEISDLAFARFSNQIIPISKFAE